MKIQLIKTLADYAKTLKEIDALMSAEVGTEEGLQLERLATLVQEYESKHFSISNPRKFPEGNLD